jgi:Fur family transcriptional regulator, zinc uptake regulator
MIDDEEHEETDLPDGQDRISMIEKAEAICRARGGRLTPQRRAVLTKLLTASRPLTAYELLDLVRPEDAAITPASIYRSLDFLVDAGLVHRLDSTRSFVACDHPDHPHNGQFLICRECGTVVEAEDKRIARAAEDLGERHGFTLEHRSVELTGVCGACRAAGDSAAGAGAASRS